MNQNAKKLLQKLLTGVLIFAVAALGVYFGMASKGFFNRGGFEESGAVLSASKLIVNSKFPSVPLIAADSLQLNSDSIYSQAGAVIIFMEVGCPPCVGMTQKWQKLISEGKISKDHVAGISFDSPDAIRAYARKNGLTFPVYSDTAQVFLKTYGVDEYPLTIVVGKSGTIQSQTQDPRPEIDLEDLTKKLGS